MIEESTTNAERAKRDRAMADRVKEIEERIEYLRPHTKEFASLGFKQDAIRNEQHIRGMEEALLILKGPAALKEQERGK